jgi:hypothetical protein
MMMETKAAKKLHQNFVKESNEKYGPLYQFPLVIQSLVQQ